MSDTIQTHMHQLVQRCCAPTACVGIAASTPPSVLQQTMDPHICKPRLSHFSHGLVGKLLARLSLPSKGWHQSQPILGHTHKTPYCHTAILEITSYTHASRRIVVGPHHTQHLVAHTPRETHKEQTHTADYRDSKPRLSHFSHGLVGGKTGTGKGCQGRHQTPYGHTSNQATPAKAPLRPSTPLHAANICKQRHA